jgi:hypothetical protein
MKSIRKHALRKSIYLVALCWSLIPGAAVAQTGPTIVDGKFALTTEARCGTTVLPPGNYGISLEGTGPFAVIRIFDNNHVVAAFLTQPQAREFTPDVNVLTLVRTGGGPYLRSLDLPKLGVEFKFPFPKSTAALTEGSKLP